MSHSGSHQSRTKRAGGGDSHASDTGTKKARADTASAASASSPPVPKTRVVRIRRQGGKVVQDCDVYVGRRCNMGGWRLSESKWHNPFVVRSAAERAGVMKRYRAWLLEQPELMAALGELKGKVLGCWCAPLPCHADVLAEMADALE